MKSVDVWEVDLPTDRPFMSERVRMVREADYIALKNAIVQLQNQFKSQYSEKHSRAERLKHPRFKAARSFWYGSAAAYNHVAFQLKAIFQ